MTIESLPGEEVRKKRLEMVELLYDSRNRHRRQIEPLSRDLDPNVDL